MEKNVFFVRHGESEANAGGLLQGPDGNLSRWGRTQSKFLSGRVANLRIDLVISSTMQRAIQTANIVSRHLEIPFTTSDLLREWMPPSLFFGKSEDDPEVQTVRQLILDNSHIPGWRHSGEETFEEIKQRARQILDYFSCLVQHRNILAITHGAFMRNVLGRIFFGDGYTSYDFALVRKCFHYMANTGITWCQHSEEKVWTLRTWNDHAHLR